MKSAAYYCENDPFAAAWLRELMAEGLIATGDVDERSIEDVKPADLHGYTQCHFFAGIGIWSIALRRAGWPDDRPIWTGSCPCQPFSAAGKGNGFADERHLWPAFFHLIDVHRPVAVLGEQVASKNGLHWLDLVSADLEGSGYAFGALDSCAAGFGSPHIRQRLYWMGHTIGPGLEGHSGHGRDIDRRAEEAGSAPQTSLPLGLANAEGISWRAGYGDIRPAQSRVAGVVDGGDIRRVADATSREPRNGSLQSGREHRQQPENLRNSEDGQTALHPLNYWGNAEWLLCRDPAGLRFRPVEPGSFPLADAGALRNRMAEVRGAGNALNLAQAQGFIEAAIETIDQSNILEAYA